MYLIAGFNSDGTEENTNRSTFSPQNKKGRRIYAFHV